MQNRYFPASAVPSTALYSGLTKREAAAISIAAGLSLVSGGICENERIAQSAVEIADALFDALEKKETK